MSDTPRTDTLLVVHDLDPKPRTLIEHARQLERELAEANKRIQRLVEAGDALQKFCAEFQFDVYHPCILENWTNAKEGL